MPAPILRRRCNEVKLFSEMFLKSPISTCNSFFILVITSGGSNSIFCSCAPFAGVCFADSAVVAVAGFFFAVVACFFEAVVLFLAEGLVFFAVVAFFVAVVFFFAIKHSFFT